MIRFRQILPAGPALVLLAACGKPVFDRDPELSPIGVDRRDLAAAQTVNVPMPPPEMPRIPDRAERASLWEPGSGGFFADQRATQIGDLLTIVIEIDDEASLDNASDRSRSGDSSLTLAGFFGYGSQIDKILPGVGPADLPSGDIVDIGSTTSASGAAAGPKRSSSPSSFGAMARPKPTVLPDPVCADTSRSAPSRPGSVTASCTGVRVV